jgi:hypothetical protein
MSAFSDIVEAGAELHIAQSRTAPSLGPDAADALSTVLRLVESAGPHIEESLELVQDLKVLWPDQASREALCSLCGEQAQRMVDVLQRVRFQYPSSSLALNLRLQLLDRADSDDQTRRCMIYLLLRLCQQNTTFPSSLTIHDVDIGNVLDPIDGGGFADIFKGRYDGVDVAIKRLRVFQNHRARTHKVCVIYRTSC